ncbi:enolase C-terminal domain-like protein [Hoeflea sp. AS60]|uniref:enolase C-terminal domain-like protein n=1 Tax=Hoeflea sp. AS60 TaxID=3135780 RepID=UPI003180A8EF
MALVAATALEYAAWDFAAKQRSVPVWRLLSESAPPPCGIYATFFGLENADATVSELVSAHALEANVKKIGADKDIALKRLADATGTELSSWAIDFKAQYGLDDARSMLHRLPDGLAWVEEPLPPHEIDLLALLQARHPIAAGEHFYSVFEFSSAREHGVSIFQPDPVFSGGLDHYIRIASSLSRHGDFYPHGNGLIPALHVAGITTNAPVLEFHFGLEAKRQVLWQHKIIPDKSATVHAPHQPGWLGDMCETVKILE